ncbi:MAG: hypothetical protein ACTSVC_06275, partial [Promethearchaeota archaeon]
FQKFLVLFGLGLGVHEREKPYFTVYARIFDKIFYSFYDQYLFEYTLTLATMEYVIEDPNYYSRIYDNFKYCIDIGGFYY